MSARRSALADDAELASIAILHTAQQKIGSAALAVQAHRAAEAATHLVAAQRELNALERALRWNGESDG